MNKKPFILGVCGGTASGKSQVCKKLQEDLTGRLKTISERDTNGNVSSHQPNVIRSCGKEFNQRVVILQQESFYKDLDEQSTHLANASLYNFDHPDAIDFDLMERQLKELRDGRSIEVSIYDKRRNERGRDPNSGTRVVGPAYVVIVHGNLIFCEARIRDLFDMRLFVDCDADSRLARRVIRDVDQLGRPLDQVISHYLEIVKPSFEQFTLPYKKHANVIIPRGAENPAAVAVIAQQIYKHLEENCGLDVASAVAHEGCRRLSAGRALDACAEDATVERVPSAAGVMAMQQQQQQQKKRSASPSLARSLSNGVGVPVSPASPTQMRGLTLATYSADECGGVGGSEAFVTGVGVPVPLTSPGGSTRTIFVDPVGARSPPNPGARTAERSTSGSNLLPLGSPPGAAAVSACGVAARQRNVSESGYSLNLTRPH